MFGCVNYDQKNRISEVPIENSIIVHKSLVVGAVLLSAVGALPWMVVCTRGENKS